MYESIDEMPVWNWFKVRDTQDLKYVYKDVDYSKKLFIFDYTAIAYEKLVDQYTEKFVIGKEGQEKIEREKEVAIAFLEAIVSGDKVQMLLAKQLEAELLEDEEKHGENDLNRIVAVLEKHLSILIDVKTISVSKFYTHINLLVESGKKTNTDQRTNSAAGFSGTKAAN